MVQEMKTIAPKTLLNTAKLSPVNSEMTRPKFVKVLASIKKCAPSVKITKIDFKTWKQKNHPKKPIRFL